MQSPQSVREHPARSSSSGSELRPLRGKRAAVVVFSHYPSDPRPRRAAEALAAQGMIVEVISLAQNEGEPSRETCNGVKVLRVPLKHWRGGKLSYILRYGAFLLGSFLLLGFRSLTRRYDLVHVHNMPDVLVFSALLPKALGARVILDLHDPMPELMMSIYRLERTSRTVRLLEALERLSVGFADLVLTPNLSFQALFSARSCHADKLRVVMNSPDEAIFALRQPTPRSAPLSGEERPFIVMYHGALVERHGLDIAVEAMAALKASVPKVELRIYGRRTPFFDQIMEEVAARGLDDSIRYLGVKTLDEIAVAIGDCDVGIIPNRFSPFTELNMPTRIFEYLACGKPVIVPRTRGIQDYLKSDEVIFFHAGDAEDLSRKLLQAYAEPSEVELIARRGQSIYLAHRWSEERAGFCQLVSELLTRRVWPGGRS